MTRDDIGDRGESLLVLLMTELCGRSKPFFRPRFLGAKHPIFDFIVELVDQPEYFFFLQVKTTTQGLTKKKPRRLRVKVSQAHVDRMVAAPAPAYVVGIDVNSKIGYLLSVNEKRDHVSSLITEFRLDCTNLGVLASEVHTFWSSKNMILSGSKFAE